VAATVLAVAAAALSGSGAATGSHGFAAEAAFSEVKQLMGFGRQWSEKHHLGWLFE